MALQKKFEHLLSRSLSISSEQSKANRALFDCRRELDQKLEMIMTHTSLSPYLLPLLLRNDAFDAASQMNRRLDQLVETAAQIKIKKEKVKSDLENKIVLGLFDQKR